MPMVRILQLVEAQSYSEEEEEEAPRRICDTEKNRKKFLKCY